MPFEMTRAIFIPVEACHTLERDLWAVEFDIFPIFQAFSTMHPSQGHTLSNKSSNTIPCQHCGVAFQCDSNTFQELHELTEHLFHGPILSHWMSRVIDDFSALALLTFPASSV
jgi:hypothetical protein